MARRPAITRSEPTAAAAPTPRRGGRPSREAAERLGERILETATTLFLAQGYGATSIELIARRCHISKRTFYHRFPDKAALFGAVLRHVVARLRPANDAALFAGGPLEAVLLRLARAILHAALTPDAVALSRMILAEASRFPEVAATVAGQAASQQAVDRIAALLADEAAAGRITLEEPQFAAAQFMQMVVALPQRRALGLGTPLTPAELDSWAQRTVTLFLDGCRGGRSPSA